MNPALTGRNADAMSPTFGGRWIHRARLERMITLSAILTVSEESLQWLLAERPEPEAIATLRATLALADIRNINGGSPPSSACPSTVQAGASPGSTAGSRTRSGGGRKKNSGREEAESVERLPGGKRGSVRQP